ncbi:hypothetical protein C1752_01293 [Acaryochloris thomasi RCC1774]|uniref:Pyruvate/2-oxoglutarate dehydrogenase complex,dihydrolipoamide dehydrogenase (E3) component n=1 Tax=Acaryochloris thomasi RCC1774 TaxID=1764569 RepID=A0A2W1JM26_9CYAN|nr:DUF4330 domain-containing protein [Acaryochloris thomasi]PZD74349.1 hypothetical protein C1752_01293 [Acaryochloris thomasi RCC1774]
MAVIDAQGRLFGKVNILDVGAALVILFVVLGIFVLPGSGGPVIGNSGSKTVEVDAVVLGLSARNPKELIRAGDKTSFIIRNAPAGQVDIKNVEFLPRNLAITQPDGSVKPLPDPRVEAQFVSNLLITLEGKAEVKGDNIKLGGTDIKVGVPVELGGQQYNFKASIIDIRPQ